MNVAERELELIPIPGETDLEIAANFQRIANEAYSTAEMRYSPYHSEMMPFAAIYVNIRRIGSSYFVEVERGFYANLRNGLPWHHCIGDQMRE